MHDEVVRDLILRQQRNRALHRRVLRSLGQLLLRLENVGRAPYVWPAVPDVRIGYDYYCWVSHQQAQDRVFHRRCLRLARNIIARLEAL